MENISADINTAVKRCMNSKMQEKKIEGGPRVLFELDYTTLSKEEAAGVTPKKKFQRSCSTRTLHRKQ